MLGIGLFKRKRAANKANRENIKAVANRISHNQETVLGAVVSLNRPVNGRAVAQHLGWDSASVTNRLHELVDKRLLYVKYQKAGLDGVRRNFYAPTAKGRLAKGGA